MKKLLFVLAFIANFNLYAQIPNGSVAPDFTITDYYGTSHNLYAYLNSGKTVFLEIFAAHCPSCWGYHQTHKMKNMYNNFGPTGTDEIMVLALEYDQWNDSNAFIGNGPAWVTQGNWLNGTPFPIFNVEDPSRGVFVDYNVTSYPVVYKICPDKIIERVMTSETETQLYQKVQDCQAALSVKHIMDYETVFFNQQSKSLIINQKVKSLSLYNLQGQIIKTISNVKLSSIYIGDLNSGLYLLEVQTENGPVIQKIYLNEQ